MFGQSNPISGKIYFLELPAEEAIVVPFNSTPAPFQPMLKNRGDLVP